MAINSTPPARVSVSTVGFTAPPPGIVAIENSMRPTPRAINAIPTTQPSTLSVLMITSFMALLLTGFRRTHGSSSGRLRPARQRAGFRDFVERVDERRLGGGQPVLDEMGQQDSA